MVLTPPTRLCVLSKTKNCSIKTMSEQLPQSRELQRWDRIYRAHIGSTSDLVKIAVEDDMHLELERSTAVREVEARLLARLALDGYLTTDAIKEVIENWHEDEVL